MIIRKRFKIEVGHTVRNASSYRCSHSYHGHSAVIDVFFEGRQLDNAQMLMDFGLMKEAIGPWIDSQDHCMVLCDKDDPETIEFFKKYNDRYIIVPFNPTAEMLSIFIMHYINKILDHTIFNNGEGFLSCINVEYNETATGMARCNSQDLYELWNNKWDKEIIFSDGVIKDWGDGLKSIMNGGHVKNPVIKQQINLN